MPSSKVLRRILFTALEWAVGWGLTGAAAGVVMILVEPDTGHISPSFIPFMVGLPSAAFGGAAGLLFACLMTPSAFSTYLGVTSQTLLGCAVGGAAGVIFMKLLAHSVVTVILGALLGTALAIRYYARSRTKFAPSISD